MNDTKFYLAYGSNLNLAQMYHRCPTARPVGTTGLRGMHLVFRGSASGCYLTAEPGKLDDYVRCGVFAISERDERFLDAYEGYPKFYEKKFIQVSKVWNLNEPGTYAENVTALIYTLPTSHPLGLPSMRYLETCAQGYRDFGFPESDLFTALFASHPE